MSLSFSQACARYKTTFDFGEEELSYTYDTSRRKTGASVKYDKIPRHALYIDAHMWQAKFYGIFCVALILLGAVNAAENFSGKTFPLIMLLIAVSLCIVGLLVLRLFFNRPVPFTRIKMDPPLYVLQDQQHQTILDELQKRRTEYMRKKYAVVDFDKPYYEESHKFNWLKREHIISEQEYMQARQKISALKDKSRMKMSGSSTH